MVVNIWGTITFGLGHWSREMSSPSEDIGEKIVVDGLLEDTNKQGDGKRELRREGQSERRKHFMSQASTG